jgi:hypothetical protein
MKFLIITSCTGEKVVDSDRQLTVEDFHKGKAHVAKREKELKELLRSAGEIYSGDQHVRLMRGVEETRNAGKDQIDLHVLSAGYGLIPEERLVAPYEITFATMKSKELRDWADTLHVPQDFRQVVSAPYDFGMILLGDNYLDACNLDETLKFGGPTLLFCGTGMAKKLPKMANVRVVAISNPEAKRFSCGLIGLKGELASRVLRGIAEPSAVKNILDPKFDVLKWLDGIEGTKKSTKAAPKGKKPKKKKDASMGAISSRTAVPNPRVDYVIHIPQSWWDKPHRKQLRYFIPEWDDYVDPEYDFPTDTHWGGGAGDWSNETYAHQMYPEPNYDGILMSRAVAEKSKKKDARINQMGVHRYIRVPKEFPVMGDCGAFDYITQETPPYSTADVLDYYTRLGFDYGVSVDHLIVPAFENARKFRYELTISNAADFLKEHRKARLNWEPIGAVQGWDPASYARAAAQYVKMGYKYIGLGGLVRSSTREISSILRDVHQVVPKGINVHLFGIARPEALKHFSSLGVTSVDSASYLRRAWLVARDNYFTLDGDSYSSLRIPEVGRSFRAKRVLTEEKTTEKELLDLESKCLRAVRSFNKGKGDVPQTVDLLLQYHGLISEGGPDMRAEYQKTLEAMPWKNCPCDICKEWGVEVLIFRGNNRNRRRGFHNTYSFYRLMQDNLNGTLAPDTKMTSPQAELFGANT